MMDLSFILQVTREFGLNGGTECVAFELHRAWLSMGMDARVLTSHATEPETQEGVSLAATWLKHWAGAKLRHLFTLIAVPLFTFISTWKIARAREPKIVVSHGDTLAGDVCVVHAVNRACLAAKRKSGHYGWLLNPINLWVAWRDRLMFGGGRYRRLIAISNRVRRELQEYYGVPDDRIVTIPNGINLSRFTPEHAASRKEVRRSLRVSDDTKLVLFVGSRFRIKGLKFAIKALAQMKNPAVLLVAGNDKSGPYRQLAKDLGVADRVIFAGGRQDLPKLYPAADVFVLPTIYETFALVCLEAMASGLPVVAAPVGGIEDYLRDGENGFHINHDPTEIADKLDRVLSDPSLHQKFRAAGLATAKEYDWKKIAQQYLALFEELNKERALGALRTIGQPASLPV